MATAKRAWRALRKLHRRPGNRAEISGDGAVKTATTSRFQERLRQSRRALELLLVGSLQRSKTAGLPGDWTEE